MARVTIEDCLEKEENRFILVQLAAKRVRQILGGSKRTVEAPGNKDVVAALREIAAGKVVSKDKAFQYEDASDEIEKED